MFMDKTGMKPLICVEVINSKQQLRGKLGHMVQIHVTLPFGVNLTLNLSIT